MCRRHGISDATFYKWKAKYGGLQVSEARRLKALEEENARLKRLLADAMLDNAALRRSREKTGDPSACIPPMLRIVGTFGRLRPTRSGGRSSIFGNGSI